MLLETFKITLGEDGYVAVPPFIPHSGYISYDLSQMTKPEIGMWRDASSIGQFRKAHPVTAAEAVSTLRSLGIRAELAGSEASLSLRYEYQSNRRHAWHKPRRKL